MKNSTLVEIKVPNKGLCACMPSVCDSLQSDLLKDYLYNVRQISFHDSRVYAGDADTDFLKKRAYVQAEYCVSPMGFITGAELVVNVSAEVCTSSDPEEDDGFHDGYVEVYRMPFISDRQMLARVLKEIRKNSKVFAV